MRAGLPPDLRQDPALVPRRTEGVERRVPRGTLARLGGDERVEDLSGQRLAPTFQPARRLADGAAAGAGASGRVNPSSARRSCIEVAMARSPVGFPATLQPGPALENPASPLAERLGEIIRQRLGQIGKRRSIRGAQIGFHRHARDQNQPVG